MLPYKAPLEDILFSLQSVAGAAALADVDIDTLSEIGTHFAALAENELAPLNAVGDREGARLENGRVKMPDWFQGRFAQFLNTGPNSKRPISCHIWRPAHGRPQWR